MEFPRLYHSNTILLPDATVMAVYWYFIVISWVALYGIVFLAPRFI